MSAVPNPQNFFEDTLSNALRFLAIALVIVILAVSPFPLGGAIAWASGLQTMAIAGALAFWSVGNAQWAGQFFTSNRILIGPVLLVAAALGWAVVQIVPGIFPALSHPIWGMASDTLGRPIPATISLSPWRTEAELIKLTSYAITVWLVFRMARRSETAGLLLRSVIILGTVYAVYGLVLDQAGFQQTDIFYAIKRNKGMPSGPFMLHNSFATYCGLVVLAAIAKAFASASARLDHRRNGHLVRHLQRLDMRESYFYLFCAILAFGALVASASRAGLVSTLGGLAAIAICGLILVRGSKLFWFSLCGAIIVLPILALILANGGLLSARIDKLLSADVADAVRISLWGSTWRMITDSPWLGLGLGSFEDAYPLYASRIFPYVMDKAHCDYLEFAAGLGVPAALCWWAAILWLQGLFIRALFIRRGNRFYAVIGIGVSVLVGLHSCVDFSLQLPAVAFLYAVLLGVALGQCQPSRNNADAA